ncbi:heme-binding protein [Halomonas saccharevitans]|uniref:Heme-binding protein n=1 Tax=Halomonas saccharevitans TaxID=416872 RepID=A0ABU3NBP5_9GAMM|nr:heme-binding protein [Halomonas saccharevitans]MDT8878613.1 heme-binding protein [Halomonas saccharevitans]
MTSRLARLPLLGAALLAGSVLADTGAGLTQQNMSLELANRLVDSTLEACNADGRTAVVAAVDRGGNLVALQRDDNIGPHNTVAAQRKAFTSLSTGTSSRALSKIARDDPESANLNTLDELLLLGGGVPVTIDGEVIGALGVAGAGGSAIDEGCAISAIEDVLPQANAGQ